MKALERETGTEFEDLTMTELGDVAKSHVAQVAGNSVVAKIRNYKPGGFWKQSQGGSVEMVPVKVR